MHQQRNNDPDGDRGYGDAVPLQAILVKQGAHTLLNRIKSANLTRRETDSIQNYIIKTILYVKRSVQCRGWTQADVEQRDALAEHDHAALQAIVTGVAVFKI